MTLRRLDSTLTGLRTGLRARLAQSRIAWAALIVACHAGAGSVAAQVPADSTRADTLRAATDTVVFELEDLRVTAPRPLATATGSSAVRLSLDIPRVSTVPILAEALREMPFFEVRENSRGEAQLTLRGTESRQVAVLVDGIPLTLGWDARTDLSLIPVGAAREIQLYRGLSSVLHGPNVLGGVVDIDIVRGPLKIDLPPPLRLEGGVDHTGAVSLGGQVGATLRPGGRELVLRGGVGYRTRDGVPLASGVDQPGDAVDGRRLNSDLEHLSGFFAARYGNDGGFWASLSSFGFTAERGVAPELHTSDPRLWRVPETSRVVTALSAGTGWGDTPLGQGDLEFTLGLDYGETQIDAYESLAYENVVAREHADDRTLTGRVLGDHSFWNGTLRGAFTYAETRHVETLDPGDRSVFRQRLYSLATEVEYPLGNGAGGSFISEPSITVGASLDGASTPETGVWESRDPLTDWGLRVGGSAVLDDGAGRLHAGVSRRVRFPSLRELYSGALGKFEPNPELDPEVLVVTEAGVTGETGILEGQAVLFWQQWSNAIVRTGTEDGKFRRENRNRITATGAELLAALQLGEALLSADLTLQSVTLSDALVPDSEQNPEYQPEIFGSISLGGPVVWGIQGRAGLKYVGRQYCVNPDVGGQETLDPSGRLDLLVSRQWSFGGALRRLQATLALDNVTDGAVYDQCGLPQPGRMLRLQFRLG